MVGLSRYHSRALSTFAKLLRYETSLELADESQASSYSVELYSQTSSAHNWLHNYAVMVLVESRLSGTSSSVWDLNGEFLFDK